MSTSPAKSSGPGAPETGLGRTRMYLVGARLYQTLVVGGKSKVKLSDFEKCLDSFEVVTTAPEDVEPYISQEGKFRFQFPGEPEVSDQKTTTVTGPLVIHATTYIDTKGTNYVVTYFDLDPAGVKAQKPEALLDGGVRGMVTKGGWKVSSQKSIKLGEYPGIDVTGEVSPAGAAEPLVGRTRMFLVNSRFYQIILMGGKSSVSQSDFQKYLESFGVLREAPAVARAKPARPARPGRQCESPASSQQMTKRAPRSGNAVATRTAPRNAKTTAEPVTDDDPGPDPSKPAEVAIEVTSSSKRLVELPRGEPERSELVRRNSARPRPKGGCWWGCASDTPRVPKSARFSRSFRPGLLTSRGTRQGAPIDGEATVVAKPGYAVGGVNARIGLLVDAFQLVFMKYKNGRLDPKDSYLSAWLGDPSGGNLKNISGGGKIVAGVHGVTNHARGQFTRRDHRGVTCTSGEPDVAARRLAPGGQALLIKKVPGECGLIISHC